MKIIVVNSKQRSTTTMGGLYSKTKYCIFHDTHNCTDTTAMQLNGKIQHAWPNTEKLFENNVYSLTS